MANIGASATTGSVGPSSAPTIGYSSGFFVVQSPWGLDGQAVMVTSLADFNRKFGGLNKLVTLAADGSASTWGTETNDAVVQAYYAVKGFFDEKGAQSQNAVAFISRAIASAAGPTAAVKTLNDGAAHNTTFTSRWKGAPGGATEIRVTNPSPAKGSGWMQVEVRHLQAAINETWQVASAADAATVSKDSELITIALPVTGQLPLSTTGWVYLGNGVAGTADAYAATDVDLVGTIANDGSKTGLQVFTDQKLGSGLCAIPGKNTSTIAAGLALHAAAYFRPFLVGSPAGKNKSNVAAVISGTSSNFGAFYAPRVWVTDINSDQGGKLLIDPVGHIMGLAARMDATFQGPHKSPAGVNYPLATVVDVERAGNGLELYDDAASNLLADSFVNTIRIKNGRVVVWGLRTLSTDQRYRQLPQARTYAFIIAQGLLMAEPYTFEVIDGDGKLFSRVQTDFTSFLELLRSHGALFGDKPGVSPKATDAYQVQCDRGNNTPYTLANDELHIDLAAAASPNAESVKFSLTAAAPGFVRVSV